MGDIKNLDIKKIKVWNIRLKTGKTIRAATIEQGDRISSPLCKGCYAKCCRGSIAPILTEEEFFSRKFKFMYMESPEWLRELVPRASYLITLDISKGICPYFDSENLKCKLWPNPPASCLAYDCRKDSRSEFSSFALKRAKEVRIAKRRGKS